MSGRLIIQKGREGVKKTIYIFSHLIFPNYTSVIVIPFLSFSFFLGGGGGGGGGGMGGGGGEYSKINFLHLQI